MISENFIYLAMALHFIGGASYMYDVIKGKAQPNRVSWLLVGVFALLAFFSSRDEGAGIQALYTLSTGINPLVVVFLSFLNEKAYWKITNRDYALGAIAVSSAIIWLITGEGAIALVFAIIADFFAGLPTLIKNQNPKVGPYLQFVSLRLA